MEHSEQFRVYKHIIEHFENLTLLDITLPKMLSVVWNNFKWQKKQKRIWMIWDIIYSKSVWAISKVYFLSSKNVWMVLQIPKMFKTIMDNFVIFKMFKETTEHFGCTEYK